jgi:gluconolactonase
MGDGSVAVVELQGAALTRVAPDGTLSLLGECGGSPNGSAAGLSGEWYVANNGGLGVEGKDYWHAPRPIPGGVQRIDPDGTVTPVTTTLPGPPPRRPNDLCFGPDGTLYVTDSANWEDPANLNVGSVLALGPDGSVVHQTEVPAMPNGVAFAPDGRLFVTQSFTRKVLAFDVDGPVLGPASPFVKLPAGMPDGLCFSADGTVIVCGSVGDVIFVFAPDGTLTETIEAGPGTQPTNCCLGADGSLYVTYGFTGQLVAFDLGLAPAAVHRGSIAPSSTREDAIDDRVGAHQPE